jgi:hypothetical protein
MLTLLSDHLAFVILAAFAVLMFCAACFWIGFAAGIAADKFNGFAAGIAADRFRADREVVQ